MWSDPELPCPRLELRWERIGFSGEKWKWQCVYSLILPMLPKDSDIPDKGFKRVVFGVTKATFPSGSPICDGRVETPMRDGVHAVWDCEALGGHLPIIAVCEDVFTVITREGLKC